LLGVRVEIKAHSIADTYSSKQDGQVSGTAAAPASSMVGPAAAKVLVQNKYQERVQQQWQHTHAGQVRRHPHK
jgi:hypothetical protein